MNIAGSKVLLTGAAGGIGRCIALALAKRGAIVGLAGRSEDSLKALASEIGNRGGRAVALPFDLARSAGHDELIRQATLALGGLDVLINNAGVARFERFAAADAEAVTHSIAVNLAAPMLLTRAALPVFTGQGHGHIVNVGSAFGSLAFPCFAAYSATKFGLRGFSEALRRELNGTGIHVLYVAPRATATTMNGTEVRAMHAATRTPVDTPEHVARMMVEALERGRSELYIGWPERFFLKLNALFPRVIDRALASQSRIAARHAEAAAAAAK